MAEFEFFYGGMPMTFERPEVPEIIAKKGIKANIAGSKYALKIKPSLTKVVTMNDLYDQTK